MACGFETLDDGSVRLRCRGEWEAAVYRQGLVHDGFTRLDRVACPVVVASGDRYGGVRRRHVVAAQAAALPVGRVEIFAGLGHLGPMEDPSRRRRDPSPQPSPADVPHVTGHRAATVCRGR